MSLYDKRIEPDGIEKWLIRVTTEDYLLVKNHLNHGQPSQLGRLFLKSLGQLIQENRDDEIIRYLLGKEELTLPVVKLKGVYG